MRYLFKKSGSKGSFMNQPGPIIRRKMVNLLNIIPLRHKDKPRVRPIIFKRTRLKGQTATGTVSASRRGSRTNTRHLPHFSKNTFYKRNITMERGLLFDSNLGPTIHFPLRRKDERKQILQKEGRPEINQMTKSTTPTQSAENRPSFSKRPKPNKTQNCS